MAAAAYFLSLLLLLGSTLYVAAVLLIIGITSDYFSLGILSNMAGGIAWTTMTSYILVAVPLFVLLGEILMRSGVADRMYQSLALWLGWLPGGLIHANIASSALFAASSGSSVATAATIGTVAQPTLMRLGYDKRLVLGSIAAGGTLGILIPPSINMIIYGSLTGTSIGKLFAAGVVPGVMLAIMMSIAAIVVSVVQAKKAKTVEQVVRMSDRIRALVHIIPVLLVFAVVMGSIYLGIATPTEAASLGVVAAVGIAFFNGRLSVEMLHQAFLSSIRTTAMILLVVVASFILNFQLSVTGVPQAMADWISHLNLGPYQTIWIIVIFYLILGCFLDAVAMLVTTIAVVFPLVIALGFDPVWFGIFMTLMMELALITPPIGLNLFVVQNIRIDSGTISDVYIGVLPFVAAMIVFVGVLIYFPGIALWLPSILF